VRLIIYQPPISAEALANAAIHGEFEVHASDRYTALHGNLGPQLILGPKAEVTWRNSLLNAPQDAQVLCETSDGLDSWGQTWSALLYAALINVVLGHFDQAEAQLRLAASWDQRVELFVFELRHLRVSRSFLTQRLNAYSVWRIEKSAVLAPDVDMMAFIDKLTRATNRP